MINLKLFLQCLLHFNSAFYSTEWVICVGDGPGLSERKERCVGDAEQCWGGRVFCGRPVPHLHQAPAHLRVPGPSPGTPRVRGTSRSRVSHWKMCFSCCVIIGLLQDTVNGVLWHFENIGKLLPVMDTKLVYDERIWNG